MKLNNVIINVITGNAIVINIDVKISMDINMIEYGYVYFP
jgi:hypothetical protein